MATPSGDVRAARRATAAGRRRVARLLLALLAAATQPEHQVQRRLLLDVVVRERAAVLELLAREDEALLVRRDAFLVLNFLFDVVDRVRGLDVERDGLASECFYEDLHCVSAGALQ